MDQAVGLRRNVTRNEKCARRYDGFGRVGSFPEEFQPVRAVPLEELDSKFMEPLGQVHLSRPLSHAVRAVVGHQ